MSSHETSINLPNFSLESKFASLSELKSQGYVGFGTIGIIMNEDGEILLVNEATDRQGQDKKDKWSLLFETGKEDETPKLTMLSGIGGELGFNLLSKIKLVSGRTFGFDFRRYEGDRPSRSFISLFYLPKNLLTKREEWGAEIRDAKWFNPQALLDLPKENIRINVQAIIQEFQSRNLLVSSNSKLSNVSLPPRLDKQYLLDREATSDLFWDA